jgi:1-acyl-sn-glycerol-3-phosphate acyltransferase
MIQADRHRLLRGPPGNRTAAAESRTLWLSVLGESWFWFYIALVTLQVPRFCHDVLHGTGAVIALTIVVLSLGVGVGALLCGRLSAGKLEIGLVPFGSCGLTVFALDWIWGTPRVAVGRVVDLPGLMALPGGWRVLIDIAAIGICGGLFVVPLNALVQQRSKPLHLARIRAAGIAFNALFMIVAWLLSAGGAVHGLTAPELIGLAALVNAAVALYIYHLLPEFLLRFVCYLLVHVLYRLRKSGATTFPDAGAALIVSNHVTFVDALVISAACRRPIHFIMDAAIFNAPVIRTLARGMKAIPIAPAKEDPVVLEQAFESAAAALRDGDLVCIFPEGHLTRDGRIDSFRPGMMRILTDTPVPVVPIAIVGLWGSMFSKHASRVWRRLPRKLGARIAVNVGAAVAPCDASPQRLRELVQMLYDRGT